MSYISGFVVAVPTEARAAHADFARRCADLFLEFGATRSVDAWGDDVPSGVRTDFPRAVAGEPSETVCFSWLEFPDRAAADAAHAKMMSDPRMDALGAPPFDGKRMIYGGFEVVAEAGAARGGYIDGALLPAKADGRETYAARARSSAEAMMEAGALRVVDAWGDFVPEGKWTDMRRAVAADPSETVVFAFIEWPSKAVRDAAWPKLMSDPRMSGAMECGAIDMGRMISAGFTPLVDA